MNTALERTSRDDGLEWFRHEGGLAVGAGLLVLLVAGFFDGAASWIEAATLGTLMAITAALGADRLRTPARVESLIGRRTGALRPAALWAARRDLALGALLLLLAHAFVQLAGTMGAEVYPLLYALLAFQATFQPRIVTLALIALAAVVEMACHLSGHPPGLAHPDLAVAGMRVLFLAVFGGMHLAFTHAELMRQRNAHQAALEREQRQRLEAARAWRLVATGKPDTANPPRPEAEQMLATDAIDAIQSSVAATLRMLRASLDGHTAALLWLDPEGLRLELHGADTRSKHLVQTLQPGEGALAGVLRKREVVTLAGLRPEYQGLPYYLGGQAGPVRHFMGVPVMEREHLRGVLCVDRTGEKPFDAEDIKAGRRAADAIVRSIQTERLFLEMERSRYELERFYESSRRLNHTLTPTEVYDVALESIQALCRFDFAAIVLSDPEDKRGSLRVARVEVGDPRVERWARALDGFAFRPNNGLVSMAIEMRVALPHSGAYRESQNVVFTLDRPLSAMRSLLILPLVVHDQAHGAVVIASAAEGAFAAERRQMLEVVSNQVAISLQNARMYEAVEQLATTDGLTGLSNHRTFKRQADEVIARSQRGAGAFTLLLTDIDHFKSINDTYGHPVGDEVLRRVSATFQRVLRQTDLPARYGGEEFAVLLEGTDLDGALQIAERLRTEVESLTFVSAQREFSISMSFGVAEYPLDAEDKATLIESADQALYYAKSHGRNQVRAWRSVRNAPDRKPHGGH